MSVSCFKNYSLTINQSIPPPQVYWTFDSLVGGKYVDSISGVQFTPTNISSATGIINNGIRSNVNPGSMSAGPSAAMALGATGGSLTAWYKMITAPNLAGFTDGPGFIMSWASGHFLANGLIYTNVPPVFATGTWIPPKVDITSAINVGDWVFIATTIKISTKTLITYVNGSSIGSLVVATVPPVQATGSITFSGVVTSTGIDYLADEVGYWGNRVLTPTEVAAIYNGGIGARPPGA